MLSRPVTHSHDKKVTDVIPVCLTTPMPIISVEARRTDIEDMHDETWIQPKAINSVSLKIMSSDSVLGGMNAEAG
jgi:hypothetical protein